MRETKIYCDLCGKEITDRDFDGGNYSKYKLKKHHLTRFESWWIKLDVHKSCWRDLTKFITSMQTMEEDAKNAH